MVCTPKNISGKKREEFKAEADQVNEYLNNEDT